MKTSFGEYFDDQRDRMVGDMQHKRYAELYNAWREDYDNRIAFKRLREEDNEDNEEVNTDSLQNEENWENEGGTALPYEEEEEDTQQLFWWESIGT